MDDFEKHLEETLKDPEFKKIWEAGEEEFQETLAKMMSEDEEKSTVIASFPVKRPATRFAI